MRAISCCLGVLIALSTPASAQYFGANKVRYDRFEFQVLETPRFDIYYYPSEERAAREAGRMAERWYVRLSGVLDHELSSRQPLILYENHVHFQQTNAIPGFIGEGTGGVTEALRRRIVLPFASTVADTDHVIGHELVHAFQFDMASRTQQRGLQLPLWFVEGMAEYLSIGPADPQTAMWLRDAALNDKLPRIKNLNDPKYFPYRWGQAFWAYAAGRWGDQIVGAAFERALSADPVRALEALTGLPEEDLSRAWHAAIREAYAEVLRTRQTPEQAARPMFGKRAEHELNVAPSLSPDGTRVVFLSSRERLAVDLFLANVETGKVIRRLSSSATDPHLTSLQFVNAAGSWDATGNRFAYASIRNGRPHVTLVDGHSGKRLRRTKFDKLGEILHPALAPDGNAVAFSASQGGMTDLYLYDLQADVLTRLTSDLPADLQPAWSPDGERLAFVTERFSSKPELLAFGPLQLAEIDLKTKRVTQVMVPGALASAKQLNPQWSRDGRRLVFLSDPQGVTDIYELDLQNGEVEPLTRLATGVTGITASSPAVSLASTTGRLAFSTLWNGDYGLFLIDKPTPQTVAPHSRAVAATLPPLHRGDSAVVAALADPTRGLPASADFPAHPYKPRLSLEYAGQPYIGAGTDSFGTYLGGGVSFLFGDILGDHMLGIVAQVQGDVRDFSGQVSYVNRKSRLGWGGIGEQLTYRGGAYSQRLATVNGEPALVEELVEYRQVHRQLSGIVEYPFSRAQRIELSGGVRSIGLSADVFSQTSSLVSGAILSRNEQELPGFETLVLAEGSAALVYDTAVFGPASPLIGRRYRFDVSQTTGTLRFTSLLADFRQYVMPVRPFTFAARGLLLGRYGSDVGDPRLAPLYLGYPTLVRGYEWESIEPSECRANATSACPELDRLIGDRIAVVNAEVRFPLVGVFRRELTYGVLPAEGVLFADAGVAWTRDRGPAWKDDLVRSVGAAVRVNALGYAVLEFAAVRPLDRNQGWMFTFGLQPGF